MCSLHSISSRARARSGSTAWPLPGSPGAGPGRSRGRGGRGVTASSPAPATYSRARAAVSECGSGWPSMTRVRDMASSDLGSVNNLDSDHIGVRCCSCQDPARPITTEICRPPSRTPRCRCSRPSRRPRSACARSLGMAGVSHNAPYHHFGDRAALLGALGVRAMRRPARGPGARRSRPRDRARSPRLRALGAAYVRYAADHPQAFALIFDPEYCAAGEPVGRHGATDRPQRGAARRRGGGPRADAGLHRDATRWRWRRPCGRPCTAWPSSSCSGTCRARSAEPALAALLA